MSAWPRRSSGWGCGCSPTTATGSPGTWSTRHWDVVGDEEQIGPEGCLSIPGMRWDCRRHLHVVARGWNMHGEPVVVEGSELLARCIQHETDHLDGVLFVDRLDPETRRQAMSEIRAAEWFQAADAGDPGQPAPIVREGQVVRLVFAGTPDPAVPSLRALLDSPRHEVVAVVTRPDAPAGRGRKLVRSPVGAGRRRGRDPGAHARPAVRPRRSSAQLAELAPDCCPVVAYGALVPRKALDVPRHGWVNLHFSLLPAWRGAAPVQAALRHGDEITGASTFRLEEGLDTGPVYGVVTEQVRATDTAGDLLGRLATSGAALLVATLDGIEDGTARSPPAARRGRLARPEGHRRRRPRRLDRAAGRDRPARSVRHPGAGGVEHVPRRAPRPRPGHPARSRLAAELAARGAARREAARARRHRGRAGAAG